jgi:hypothetical protein
VATTAITFISAMQTTRSMSRQESVQAWMIGAFGALPQVLFSQGRRIQHLATNDEARGDHDDAGEERIRKPPAVARTPRSEKLAKKPPRQYMLPTIGVRSPRDHPDPQGNRGVNEP